MDLYLKDESQLLLPTEYLIGKIIWIFSTTNLMARHTVVDLRLTQAAQLSGGVTQTR